VRVESKAHRQDRPSGPRVDWHDENRPRPLPPSVRRLARAAAWSAAVVLLTPMILVAGVVTVVAIPLLGVGRHATPRTVPLRRRTPSVAPVLHLDTARVEPSLAVLDRRAA
jgi:hypothetical protein